MNLESIKRLKRRLTYSSNWNIGFCDCSSDRFIESRGLGKIQWMNHNFKDRFFADPFILDITEDRIILLVEECPFEKPRGVISELVINKATKCLIERRVILQLDTHLSYPAIIRSNGRIYVYPENSQSGGLKIYEYNQIQHRLENPRIVLNEPVTDGTILDYKGNLFMVATKYPDSQKGVYLYSSASFLGHFHAVMINPFENSPSCSRPAGNWIMYGDDIYRPAQDCSERYGGGISIMRTFFSDTNISEELVFSLHANSFKYNRGLHTVNFKDSLCVVDGYGYLYPIIGRILCFLLKLFNI